MGAGGWDWGMVQSRCRLDQRRVRENESGTKRGAKMEEKFYDVLMSVCVGIRR